jgi:hypothetical protein
VRLDPETSTSDLNAPVLRQVAFSPTSPNFLSNWVQKKTTDCQTVSVFGQFLISLILPTEQAGFDIKQLCKNPLGTKNASIKLSACCFSIKE